MSTTIQQITISVVAGILTFIFLELVKASTIKAFNWYMDKIYDSVIVGGNWEGTKLENDVSYGFEFQIIQRGSTILGTYISHDEYSIPNNSSNTRFFSLKGTIKNNYLLLSYYPMERKNIGGGSFILQILDDGNEMSGSMCFLKTSNGSTGATTEIILKRKP